jgi:hypothetical protein
VFKKNTVNVAETADDAKDKINYLKYCHSKIDDVRKSTYSKAFFIMLAITFIIPTGIKIILGLNNDLHVGIKCIFLILSILFLISFLWTAVWCIKCLIPFNKDTMNYDRPKVFMTFIYIKALPGFWWEELYGDVF